MIEAAPLAKAVHIADDARRISKITIIDSLCASASKRAGEKHVSRFLFFIQGYLFFESLCLSAFVAYSFCR
jgi:hypothetical protein